MEQIIKNTTEKLKNGIITKDITQFNNDDVNFSYYNSGGIDMVLIIGVHIDNIKHQCGEYTFLTGRQPEYQWIRTTDLQDTYKKAKNAPVARFL